MAPLLDSQYCWAHSPEHAQEAQEARRLGGIRRKREFTLLGAYEFEGVGSIDGLQRILEIAMLDTLSMENSLPRNRTLAYLTQVALKALEVGNVEERLASLEQAVHGQRSDIGSSSLFETEPPLLEAGEEEKPNEAG
jgi:hypothetical protein